ncbi:hypothetical protein [Methanocalculus sp. MSAO_Arc2]
MLEAMDFFGLDAGYIVTYDKEENMLVSGKQISLIPARKFEY